VCFSTTLGRTALLDFALGQHFSLQAIKSTNICAGIPARVNSDGLLECKFLSNELNFYF
jgi:hypothetical protein